MATEPEKRQFAAEIKALLDIMVNSLYTQKDIFLRELVSNASDALDRRRFLGLSDPSLLPTGELHIRLEVDKDKRRLSIVDNGIGMSRDELVEHIGTIAKSGTKEFLAAIKQKRNEGQVIPPELIGQFGVGFYSCFMVSSFVSVLTRKVGEETASLWKSPGDGTYTIEDAKRDEPGTSVILKLKPEDADNGIHNYIEHNTLREIVKKHSDFVGYPIKLLVPKPDIVDKDGKRTQVDDDETLNSMKAIWTRPKSEVKEAEYTEFYRHISRDWGEPLEIISAQMEGTFNARALLFIPKTAPLDLYRRDSVTRGLHLYAKRVLIVEDCHDLLPEWLRFVKGVVDSEDISLNVSREMLQQDRQMRAIKRFLVKKVLDAIFDLRKENGEKWKTFLKEFNVAMKEGLTNFGEHRDRVLDLVVFHSSNDQKEMTSLADYLTRMKPAQEAIYYITGPSIQMVQSSPHMEAFKKKGIEVLYLIDPVDEFWAQQDLTYKEKPMKNIGKGEIDLTPIADKETAERKQEELELEYYKGLCEGLRTVLGAHVKEVRISGRLTKSAACLVGEAFDPTPQMEEMMRRMGQAVPDVKRVLEINKDHPFIEKLRGLYTRGAEDPMFKTYAELLLGQAIIAEGSRLPDPAAFSTNLIDIMAKSMPESQPTIITSSTGN